MKLVARQNPRRELHVVLDNSSTHGPPEVVAWLKKNPRIHFHYTPTSASWLNQVEGFFGIFAKQSLRSTEFLSKKRPHRVLHRRLEQGPQAVYLDQARPGHHPKPPTNA